MNDVIAESFEDTPRLRRDIVRTCQRLLLLGFFIGTWGNVSVRTDGGLLVTPSRIDYAAMKPEDIVLLSWEGNKLKGKRLPSSEADLHRIILKNRPDLAALIHSHSQWASSVAAAGKCIPAISEDLAQIIGGKVHCSKYVRGGRHIDMAGAAWEAMGFKSSAVLLANHGAVVGGRSLSEALVAAQVIEKAAMMFINASALGGCIVIPEGPVQKERDRYLFKYGTDKDFIKEASTDDA